ncbi:glycosyltransferase [Candidatus Beckwithbacteria bacterium]|nr:glycosyltransferase [Candidatus Beckwithbacteria bacterium]
MARTIKVSLGVFAHNEEKNISKVLNSILKQKTEIAQITEVWVVSSGSHDKTNRIIRQFSKKDKRIKLMEQFSRIGKTSAVNTFIRRAKSSVLVIISADLRLHTHAIEEIITPFLHANIGMVGAHAIPTNIASNPIGQQVRLLWKLHHLVSLQNPKCGEMVAFRKVIRLIPKRFFDEATLEVLLKLIGYKVIYAPRAIVYNKGPRSTREFIRQQRRNYVGHQWIQKHYNYQVATMDTTKIGPLIINYLLTNPRDFVPMIYLLLLQFVSRTLGWFDYYIFGKNPFVWKMVSR